MSLIQKRDEMVSEYCGGRSMSLDEIGRHFSHHMPHDALEPLPKPCQDCAVTGGLYTCVSALLSLLPPEEVKFHSDRWSCHNHGDRACRGNINYQATLARSLEGLI
jgi:hypothetical protein